MILTEGEMCARKTGCLQKVLANKEGEVCGIWSPHVTSSVLGASLHIQPLYTDQ